MDPLDHVARGRTLQQLAADGKRYLEVIQSSIDHPDRYPPYDSLAGFEAGYQSGQLGVVYKLVPGPQSLSTNLKEPPSDSPAYANFHEFEAHFPAVRPVVVGKDQPDASEGAADGADAEGDQANDKESEAEQLPRQSEDSCEKQTDQSQHATDNTNAKDTQEHIIKPEARVPAEQLDREQTDQSSPANDNTSPHTRNAIVAAFEALQIQFARQSNFYNAISTDGRILIAQRNFARLYEPLHWSEIVTYGVALCHPDRDLAAIGKVRRIIRSTVQNEEWHRVKEMLVRKEMERCRNDWRSQPRVNHMADEVCLMYKPGDERFETLMGTENGMGVAYLVARNTGRFPMGTRIGCVLISPAKSDMEVRLVVEGERDEVMESPEKLWRRQEPARQDAAALPRWR